MLQIKEFLKTLSESSGVSGYEAQVREIIRSEFSQYADETHVDPMGNLIAVKRGTSSTESPYRIMLAGHMDEIGLVVTRVEKGFIRFSTVGGFDARVLPAQEVMVHGKRNLPGIIATRPPHLMSAAEQNQTEPVDKMLIDVGLTEDEVNDLVRVGDMITVDRSFIELQNGLVAGKAMDDRAAVACIADAMRQLQNMRHTWDVYAVATVQEEVGLKGAMTSTFGMQPDVGVALDVGHGDMPGVSEVDTIGLGQGPALGVGASFHPLVTKRLLDTAKSFEIPCQTDPVPGRCGTDAWAMQVTREGVPTALISIPLRYMHTAVETVSIKDLERISHLLALFISGLDDEFAQELRLRQRPPWEEQA